MRRRYKDRWFECAACGEEYWTPDQTLGPKPTEPTEECWLCGTRDARVFLYSVQAGTPYSPQWWQRIEEMVETVAV
mgnify:CR=1 FL=1